MASTHQADLVMCRKQPGIGTASVCPTHDGRCVACDSFVEKKLVALVRICDDCSYGSFATRCVVCGGRGVNKAYFCKDCVALEKDREGCVKIINLGASRVDSHYAEKRYGTK
jgi:PHD finger-like domain-containing protein 5A